MSELCAADAAYYQELDALYARFLETLAHEVAQHTKAIKAILSETQTTTEQLRRDLRVAEQHFKEEAEHASLEDTRTALQ